MKIRFLVLSSWMLAIALTSSLAMAQSLGRPGATAGGRRQQSLPEYALGKINPQNREYGAGLQSRRDSIVTCTIDDAYFWSNCASLGLLTLVTGCFLLELRASDKKEIVAATLISQLWNGRVGDRIELDRRTAAYNALADRHAELVETALSETSGEKPETGDQIESVRSEYNVESITPVPEAKEDRTEKAMPVAPVHPPETANDNLPTRKKAGPVTQDAASGSTERELKQSLTRLEQELRLQKSQNEALKQRENNLVLRLNSLEEYRRQH